MNEGLAVSEIVSSQAPSSLDPSRIPARLPVASEKRPHAGRCGMLTFLCSEVSLFSTLILAYVVFYGTDSLSGGLGGPTPREALSLPLVCCTTLCLLYSSATIHFAHRALRRQRRASFVGLWGGTIALGVIFLLGTAFEWYELITRHHLTISRNLFGTTFYTLVGFHALHVTIGVLVMSLILALALAQKLPTKDHTSVELVSWYWHFVDGVWIVVFSVVYLVPHLG